MWWLHCNAFCACSGLLVPVNTGTCNHRRTWLSVRATQPQNSFSLLHHDEAQTSYRAAATQHEIELRSDHKVVK